jgi:ACS family hexuronate transporter-like MFS transporter
MSGLKTETSSRHRWTILLMLFLATTINYTDRSIIGVLGPTLKEHVFRWTNLQYGYIVSAFMIAYAIGQLAMGGVIDRLGTKIGYAISIGIWSFFSLMHAFVTVAMGWVGFAVARFGLGFGEAGNFPSCIKTVAEWFPRKERAFATGIFNAGSNIGAIIAPLVIPLIVTNDGKHWQWAFCFTFIFSLAWLLVWLNMYKKPEWHPKVSPAELRHIQSDAEAESPGTLDWPRLFRIRETWAVIAAKVPDIVWWFYLFWSSFFLHARFHLELKGLALPLILIYIIADSGSVFGGWLSSFLIRKGFSVNFSRKFTMLLCSCIILPVIFATRTSHEWIAVLLIGFAAGGHQAWSANAYTLTSDLFPKKATASVIGIGGSISATLSIIATFALGHVLDHQGPNGYFYAFLFAAFIYLIALAAIHVISPKMIPVNKRVDYAVL